MTDLLDPELHASGEALRILRGLPPVSWTPGRRGPGYWSVTGHPELCEAAREPGFSSYWGTRPEVIRAEGARRPLHNLDGEPHVALRAIASRAVHADRLAAFDDALASIVAEELASGDIVAIAERIVTRTFAHWLGLVTTPAQILASVVAVHDAGAAVIDTARDDPAMPDRREKARRAAESIAALIASELEGNEERRSLRTLTTDGVGLGVLRELHARSLDDSGVLRELHTQSPDEAAGLGVLFLEAGIPTTIDAIAHAVVDLARHRPAIDDTSMMVEELLRRASPIAQFARRASRDVELAGQRIREGQQIVLWFAAANHDARVFPDPDELRARSPNPHVAFGIGPHRCIGAVLGRRIVRAVVDALRPYRIALAEEPERRASSYLRGYRVAPVTLAPR